MAAHTGKLLVTVVGASDLQDCEQWGAMDPYATVTLTGPVPPPTASTRTAMKGGTSPQWDETLALPVTAEPGLLSVQVYNQNRAAPDDLVGYGSVEVSTALQQGSGALAVPLSAHPSGRAQGHVHLRLEWRQLPPGQAEAAAKQAMPLPGTAEQQAPALSDLRPLSLRERPYDRVHRPAYTLPGSSRG